MYIYEFLFEKYSIVFVMHVTFLYKFKAQINSKSNSILMDMFSHVSICGVQYTPLYVH